MKGTRFYFAGAATTSYLRSILGGKQTETEELMMTVANLLPSVNHALMGIVGAVIQRRGYAYRAEAG